MTENRKCKNLRKNKIFLPEGKRKWKYCCLREKYGNIFIEEKKLGKFVSGLNSERDTRL